MIVDKAISVARFIEGFAIFNAVIHYWQNSWFTIHELIFILIFAFVAVRWFIWAGASKVTFNITWTMIQTLKIVWHQFLSIKIWFLTFVYSRLQFVIQSLSSLLQLDRQEYCSKKQSSSHATAACSSWHSGLIDLVAAPIAGLLNLSAKRLFIKKLKIIIAEPENSKGPRT